MRLHILRLRLPFLLSSVLASLSALSVAFAFAQGPNAESKHPRPQPFAELANVPEKARSLRNPLEADPNAISAGKKLFEQHCAECHGNARDGRRKAPALRAQEVQAASPGTLFWILTNGVIRRGMPVWSKLPEQQRWQIVSYLKSLN
jgi:cytochrome c oxidase cbb3-type subunit 2